MIKLGISAFYHDSAACLSMHNIVLAAAEEEGLLELNMTIDFQ